MSKPRHNWWAFALAMIRDYPDRSTALRELHKQTITADLSGMPRSGGASRTTEGIAIRQLPPQEQREYNAVHSAIKRTRALKDGDIRLQVIRLTMWQGYTIPGAAMIVHTSDSTARRYRWEFTMLVGMMYGFMSEDEYTYALKKGRGK